MMKAIFKTERGLGHRSQSCVTVGDELLIEGAPEADALRLVGALARLGVVDHVERVEVFA